MVLKEGGEKMRNLELLKNILDELEKNDNNYVKTMSTDNQALVYLYINKINELLKDTSDKVKACLVPKLEENNFNPILTQLGKVSYVKETVRNNFDKEKYILINGQDEYNKYIKTTIVNPTIKASLK